MKKSVKKVLTAGLASATVVNTIPYNVLAKDVDSKVEDNMSIKNKQDMIINILGVDTKLSLSTGKEHYNTTEKTLYYSKGANLTIDTREGFGESTEEQSPSDKEVINKISIKDGESVTELGENLATFSLDNLSTGAMLVFEDSKGGKEEVHLLRYLTLKYNDIVTFKVSNKEDTIGKLAKEEVNCKKIENSKGNTWYKEGTINYSIPLDRGTNISLEDYGLSVNVNGVSLDKSNIKEENGNIKFSINISDYSSKVGTGKISVEAKLGDNLGKGEVITDEVSYDIESPKTSLEFDNCVNGFNGIKYVQLNEDGNTFNVKGYLTDDGVSLGETAKITSEVSGGSAKEVSYSVGGSSSESHFTMTIDKTKFLELTSNKDNILYSIGNIPESKEVKVSEAFKDDIDLSKVKFVDKLPTIQSNYTIDGENKVEVDGWYKNAILNINMSNSETGVYKVKVVSNENIVSEVENTNDNKETFNYSIDLNTLNYVNNSADLSVYAYDMNGKETLILSKNFKYDNTKPIINDKKATLKDKDIHVYENIAYVSKGFEISGNAIDSESGVSKIEVIKDGVVVANSLPYKVTSNGEYSVKVYDKLGNLSEYPLSSFTGKNFNNIVISKEEPIINNLKLVGVTSIDDKGTLWLSSDKPSISFELDGENLNSYSITLNGNSIFNGSATVGNITKELGNLEDNTEYVLEVEAVNKVGISSKKTITFRVDTSAPTVSNSSVSTTYNDIDSGMYFKSEPVVSVQSEDTGYGGNTYYLVRDGVILSSNKTGEFSIQEDGNYSIRFVDGLGNNTEIELKDILKTKSNNLVIDKEAPKVVFELPKDGLGKDKNIYGGNFTKDLVFTDNKGLQSTTVTINGVEVSPKDVSNRRNIIHTINTEGITAKEDSSFKIIALAEDYAGNTIEKRYNFFIDTVAPEINSLTTKSEYKDRNGSIWFKSEPTVTVKSSDKLSKIKEYRVYDKKGRVRKLSKNTFKLRENDYSIQAVDSFGNETEVVLLKTLLNTNGEVVKLDKEKPKITGVLPEGGVGNWYNKDVEYTANISDNRGIKSIVAKVNDVVVDFIQIDDKELKETTVKINTSGIEAVDGTNYNIVVEVEDLAGNTNYYGDTINIDKDAPNVSVNISQTGMVRDYGTFFTQKPVIDVNSKDDGIGVDRYELYENDIKVKENKLGVFILDSGKSYSVVAVDRLGNKSERKELKEFFDWKHNTIFVNKESSAIEITRPSGDTDGWYGNKVQVPVRVSGISIYSANIYVNDELVKEYKNTEGSLTEITESIDLSKYTPKDKYTYEVKVEIEDSTGTKSSKTETILVDEENPVLNEIKVNGVINSYPYGNYFLEGTKLSFNTSDDGVGVEKIVVNDGTTEYELKPNEKFTLKSGTYSIKVIDKLGNSTEYQNLADILGLESNKFILDSGEPEIICSRPDGDLNGWFNKDVEYSANVKDSEGIYKANIEINGVSVSEFKADKNGYTDKIIKANTSSVKPVGYGEYNIKVNVEDHSGNKISWEDRIFIDKEAPIIKKANIFDDYVEKDYGVFFKGKPTLSVTSEDKGVGVKEVILLDSNDNVVSRNKGTFELSTGEYFIKVVDELGNESEKVSLQELLGLSSNRIVVDTTTPSINCNRPSGDINGWFANDVIYNVNLKDDIGIEKAKVFINGKEVDNYTSNTSNVFSVNLKADTSKVDITKDGSYSIKVVVEDTAENSKEWSDTIYIDRTAPVVNKFVIQAEGYKEGATIDGSDKYGFYIQGSTDVEVHVSDDGASSGMNYIYYTLKDRNGVIKQDKVSIKGGVANIHLPEDFKGFISAYAVDNVGNKGKENRPDGIISESSNVHVNTSKVDINLPKTEYADNSGYYLYSGDVTAKAIIKDTTSGIREIKWGTDEDTHGVVNIDNDGNITGDSASIISKDKNIVVNLEKALNVAKNKNSINVWVEVTDRVGHVSKNNRVISIDKDNPIISVDYDGYKDSNYYNTNRTATVTIKERNFKASDVRIGGNPGSQSGWKNVGENTWSNTIIFNKDGEYAWSVGYTDLAGNKGNTYSSEKFVIDKTNPVVEVSFDNNNVENGNYYKNSRVATIKVHEKNFNENLVKVSTKGTVSGWSHKGNIHTATVSFDKDGEYDLSVVATDLAGNVSNTFNSGKFIVDKTKPTISVTGVQNGISYKKNNSFVVKVGDTYIDTKRSSVTLKGRVNGNIKLKGEFNEKTGEFTFEGVPKDKKFDDLYTLKVVVYDKAGNVSEKNISFSINRYGSSYSFSDKGLLGSIINKQKDITIEEVSVDRLNKNEAKVVVIRDGEEIEVDRKYISIEESGGVDGPWVYRYSISKEAFNKDGKYLIQIYSKAMDGTGNSSLSQEYSFILDTTKPEILISGVEDSESYNAVSKKVTIDVRDISGVKEILVLLNGKELDVNKENGLFYVTIDENTKEQNLVVKVVDRAGNENYVEVKDFLITSSKIRVLLHKTWVKWVISGLVAMLSFLIILLFGKRRKDKEEERRLAEENAKMYKESTTGGSTSSSNNTEK